MDLHTNSRCQHTPLYGGVLKQPDKQEPAIVCAAEMAPVGEPSAGFLLSLFQPLEADVEIRAGIPSIFGAIFGAMSAIAAPLRPGLKSRNNSFSSQVFSGMSEI